MVHIVHDSFMFANLVQLQVREISFWVRFMVELVSGVYEPAHTWGFKQAKREVTAKTLLIDCYTIQCIGDYSNPLWTIRLSHE